MSKKQKREILPFGCDVSNVSLLQYLNNTVKMIHLTITIFV